MQKGTIKAIVLPVVFVLAVIIFSFMTNQTNKDLTTEMSEATLPVLTLYDGKTAINELYGYTEKMDAAYMRDTITPIGEDRLLPVTVKTYQTAVDKISYEIRSLDAKRLIANADVTSYTENKGMISMELPIQNLLEENEEYLLVIQLESGDRMIYYYTRIIESRTVMCRSALILSDSSMIRLLTVRKRHLSALIWKKRSAITRLCSM